MSFTYFNLLIICMCLQVINKVKVTHQGKGHIKVKVKYLHPFKFYVAHTHLNRQKHGHTDRQTNEHD